MVFGKFITMILAAFRSTRSKSGCGDAERQRDAVIRSGLFHERWYLRTYPDVANSGLAPLEHFLAHGAAEGRDPSPFFKTSYYVLRYSDVGPSGLNPLVHYVQIGSRQSREINDWYRPYEISGPEATKGSFLLDRQRPLPGHAAGLPSAGSLAQPATQERSPRNRTRLLFPLFARIRRRRNLRQLRRLVEQSGLFFEIWYLRTYQDVADKGMNPIDHYLKLGAGEGRNPSPFFDTNFYLSRYDDVRASGINPLVHFVRFGIKERRKPNAWFDPATRLPDVPTMRGGDGSSIIDYIAWLAALNLPSPHEQ
ncbi:MAG: hypothetical protein OEW21_10515 [Betaproteobacteria bacterium]|nr:hypothetical protein [Betaproteobacteria bacterium]